MFCGNLPCVIFLFSEREKLHDNDAYVPIRDPVLPIETEGMYFLKVLIFSVLWKYVV